MAKSKTKNAKENQSPKVKEAAPEVKETKLHRQFVKIKTEFNKLSATDKDGLFRISKEIKDFAKSQL